MKSAFPAVVIAVFVASLEGCATTRGPRQVDAVAPAGTLSVSNWSRVSELVPAANLVVTARGLPPGSRYFVSADEFALTVLNLTAPTLPAVSTRVLRNMASRHPEYFAAMQGSGVFAEGDVRVGRTGVFVADRKVADLGQVVETIARNDVIEIRGPVVARGSVLGTLLGGWLGFAVGVVPGLGGASTAVAWPLLMGSVAGGAFLGFHWSSHETEGVIYRVP